MQVVEQAPERLGRYTVRFRTAPRLLGRASVVGPMEGKGPLGQLFDRVTDDDILGQKSWEQAETAYMVDAGRLALENAGLEPKDIDLFVAGDLLNQMVTSNVAAGRLGIPLFGIYSACASFTQGLFMAAAMVDGGYARHVLVATASHHKTAERQYRYPNEFAHQRPPTATWTVTGAGAVIVGPGDGDGPRITSGTIGRVLDLGIKDPYDMGSAMAPAAVDTITRLLSDTGTAPEDYDVILTGDLGELGSKLLYELTAQSGLPVSQQHKDAGVMIYAPEQDAHAGGSGAACVAVVFASWLVPQLAAGQVQRVMVAATGALHSPTLIQQGGSIPSVCHAVTIEGGQDARA